MSDNWAVCIGINHYDNLTPLDFAREDAEAAAAFFRAKADFKTVYLFTEDAEPIKADNGPSIQSRPTLGNLYRFLRIRFDQAFLRASDNLWFFFAGHGRRDQDRDYLLPMDADPGDVGRTGIEVRYVVEQLKKSGAGNVILLLDACRNTGARDGSTIGIEKQKGAVTISSCSAAEFSYEIEQLRHGAFTYALLEGLHLNGERNCATVERLDAYLQARVPELCRFHGKPLQTPCTLAEPLSKRHFILIPSLALQQDLQPLKVEALEAEATGDLLLADQLWWRINAVDPADGPARAAIRRLAYKLSSNGLIATDGGIASGKSDAEHPQPDSLPSRPRPFQMSPSRRKVVVGGVLGAAGLIAIGSATYPFLSRRRRPSVRSEQIAVVTVDDAGIPQAGSSARMIEAFREPIDDQTSIDFSVIPAGGFWMGSPVEEPLRRSNEGQAYIRINRFAISRTAITQQQWFSVVQAHRSPVQWPLPFFPSSFKGDDLPVETVNWRYASEFCSRLAELTGLPCRLPTEAEWEFACRADTKSAFHFGPTLTPELANYCGTGGGVCGTSFGKSVSKETYGGVTYTDGAYARGPAGTFVGATRPVASYPPNGFGLYEMHGNVWEHCLDSWTERLEDLPTDGRPYLAGHANLHPLRGGAWSHNPAICRSAYREWIDETSSGWEGRIGFRVAIDF